MRKIAINIIVEKSENTFQGRIEDEDFRIYDEASSTEELETKFKDLLADFIAHEGQETKKWKNVKIEDVEFKLEFDLTEFFKVFEMFNISKVADYSGINSSQLRQYATGKKHPSIKQAELIQSSIHRLADTLKRVSLV